MLSGGTPHKNNLLPEHQGPHPEDKHFYASHVSTLQQTIGYLKAKETLVDQQNLLILLGTKLGEQVIVNLTIQQLLKE